MWRWLRDGRPGWWGFLGAVVLMIYGVIPTLQTSHFGRVYAAYGGFFIVLSLLWGWRFDGNRPDRADVIGATIALIGVCLMMYLAQGIVSMTVASTPDSSGLAAGDRLKIAGIEVTRFMTEPS